MVERIDVNLPFNIQGEVNILQGFHGPWSHKEFSRTKDLTYAVDFKLNIGTPVIAARDGRLYGYYDGSTKFYSGTDPKMGNSLIFGETNFVFVEHQDGTVAIYSHLAKGSCVVGTRQKKIAQGELLAFTGLSGWVGPTPHLHFQLYKKDDFRSIPISFTNYSGPLEHSQIFPNG
jgi:murein DD-endopeptidase MepM/ murein hydrolase activator NlpD